MRHRKRTAASAAAVEPAVEPRSDGIPGKFQLAGHTIEVRIVTPRKWKHGKGAIGIWMPEHNRIEILSTCKGSNRQQVWAHEAIHAMLDVAGYGPLPATKDLSRDEQFVDRLGHLLQQMLTTME